MKRIQKSIHCSAPAENVWLVLADFAGFLNWAGGGQGEIRIEGEGIGMIRHLKMGVGEIAERLVYCDQDRRELGYELVYGEPIGMKQYRATVAISEAEEGCDIKWTGEFVPVDPAGEDSVAATLAATYAGMTAALDSYVLSQS